MVDDHVDEASRGAEKLVEDDLEQRLDVNLERRGLELDTEFTERLLERLRVLRENLGVDLVEGFEDEVDERPRMVNALRLLGELAGLVVVVDVAPESVRKRLCVHGAWERQDPAQSVWCIWSVRREDDDAP